jgi:hydrogenase/urease accessory protein HupE
VRALLVAAALLALCAPALAHDETVSTSDVTVQGRTVTWRVDVGVAGLAKVLKLPDPVSGRDLAAARQDIADYLRRGLTVYLDGRQVPGRTLDLEPGYEDETGRTPVRVLVTFGFQADRPIETLRVRVAFFSDLTRQHRAVVTLRWGAGARQLVRLGPSELQFERATFTPSALGTVREFLLWGMEHIFIGYDHIAFLLALLLVAAGWGELLRIVTAFTLAHSLTLLLSALDVIRVPSRLTEVLIAASIVYVAAENLWMRHAPRARWLLTFAFGLVHGMGFASELRVRLAELAGRVVLPVVSFNLGVELGQIVIVAAVFPLLLAVRRSGEVARARVVRWGSAAILVLGLGWLIERLAA